MTKGDKIKLRAELAGKAMEALICSKLQHMVVTSMQSDETPQKVCAVLSISYADALMAELGISIED